MADDLFLLFFGLWIYFIPALVAFVRPHQQRAAILVINLFLGWTVLGWVVALAWAVSGKAEERRPALEIRFTPKNPP